MQGLLMAESLTEGQGKSEKIESKNGEMNKSLMLEDD